MPIYMVEFGYTPEVWAGLVKSPERPREDSDRPANRDLFAAEVCTGDCTASHASHVFHA